MGTVIDLATPAPPHLNTTRAWMSVEDLRGFADRRNAEVLHGHNRGAPPCEKCGATGVCTIRKVTSRCAACLDHRGYQHAPSFPSLVNLPDRSVDHAIMDPPYEAEAHSDQRRTKVAGWRDATKRGERNRVAMPTPLDFAPITPLERALIARELGRVLRGWAVIFCQVEAVADWRRELVAGGLKYRRAIPWVKPDAMPSMHGRWPGQSFETIVLASAKKAPTCPGGGKSVWYHYPRAQGTSAGSPGKKGRKAPHATTKPLPLMRDLVELVSRPGDLVIDPYAGSATTGIACKMLGRAFLGWELDEAACEIAQRRITGQEVRPNEAQPSLFGAM